jgi:hypothetical protein
MPQYEKRKEDKVDRRGKEKSLTRRDLRRRERTIVLVIGFGGRRKDCHRSGEGSFVNMFFVDIFIDHLSMDSFRVLIYTHLQRYTQKSVSPLSLFSSDTLNTRQRTV